MIPANHRQILFRCALTLGVVALTACASLEQLAPPVATLSSRKGADQLEHGRDIYITKCARCHAVEPVRKYSAAHWGEIVPEMTDKSKLSPSEVAALQAYLEAVLKTPVTQG